MIINFSATTGNTQSMQPQLYPLALSHLDFTIRKLRHVYRYFVNLDRFFTACDDELERAHLTSAQMQVMRALDWVALQHEYDWMQANGVCLLAYDDMGYPSFLREIDDPPPFLYVMGDVLRLNRPQFAIVGARRATQVGLKHANDFAQLLVAHDYIITSGMALGIDGAAHRGALAVGGQTIAVLGTGLARLYPNAHRSLAREISQSGAVISEYPIHSGPEAYRFPRRNRIISGLSEGVLVVEAARRSGSLITAKCAAAQGREVFALPGSIHNTMARGCHHLLREGAKLVESVDDILSELTQFQSMRSVANNHAEQRLSDSERKVYSVIDGEPSSIDAICSRLDCEYGHIAADLMALSVKSLIVKESLGYIRC